MTFDIDVALQRTTQLQADAADPQASVWVSANAGTGKTHVLTNRVLRLLLAETRPERILCLTYTKAAAAEMASRVFAKLSEWATIDNDALATALAGQLGRKPTERECNHARTLFAQAIETPGGLKVQTIHAFCERLLQRFPLEAGVPPGFAILDDVMARDLQREATDAMLRLATARPNLPLGRALAEVIAYAADDRFDDVLREALAERDWLEDICRLAVDPGEDPFEVAEGLYRGHFEVRQDVTRQGLLYEAANCIQEAQLRRLIAALAEGSKTDVENADALSAALAATSTGARVAALGDFLLTAEGEPRKRLMTKAVRDRHPDLEQIALRAQSLFCDRQRELKSLEVVVATVSLARLANDVLQRFTNAKAHRAALDFDDLIKRTARLLATPDSAAWVLYKLDEGIEHILVDESQDTSPQQWQVVQALANEFFADTGARSSARTIFAVGDEKQSIYSFQGARPELFKAMGDHFERETGQARQPWRRIPLTLSFRTVKPVLEAVDWVFADPVRTPGVEPSEERIHHEARRFGQSGTLEIWETEQHAESSDPDPWSPLVEGGTASPIVTLANRIARTIRHWLDSNEKLVSENRPITPGDILILVRKRAPFAGAMVAALKALDIPVAGADRIRLTEQIAVQDLLALGDFLTLPEDDLSLAAVLKSPLFGLDDDDLIAIAPRRKGTLWKALLESAATNGRHHAAAETLKRWRKAADFDPPFEFFANLLDKDGMRSRLLARLGPEAADPIDELLTLAIQYDEGAPPSLPGFLNWLRASDREIKRDMEHGRNEVRVMTVHGSKGLEAPIVFLPDTCTTRSGRQQGGLIRLGQMRRPVESAVPFCWPVAGSSRLPQIRAANTDLNIAENEERNRLLYVAMTRARDRLYVCGFEGKRGRGPGCWYDLVRDAVIGNLQAAEGIDGNPVHRLVTPQQEPAEKPRQEHRVAVAAETLPDWARRRIAHEQSLSVPLAPSRLAPYDTDDEGEPVEHAAAVRAAARLRDEPPADAPAPNSGASPDKGGSNRFLRGTLTHALLEHLPLIEPHRWLPAAEAFVAVRGASLSAATRRSIVSETLKVLTDPVFGSLFGPMSRAEVPIIAEIPHPRPRQPALKLTGQIDRLVVHEKEVLIVDYKTNRPPPTEPAAVAPAYVFQLAAYRMALKQIYPGKKVVAALLWTETPSLMEIPAQLLDEATTRLWDLHDHSP